MIPLNQKGFAALEALLILVIFAIIGGTGWYVMSSKNDIYQNYDSANSSSSPVNSATKKNFEIKEWGVKATYVGKVDLIYKVTSDNIGENWAQLSSKQMKQADPTCDEQSQLGGIIIRLHSGENLRGPAGDDTGQSVESAIKTGVISEYSQVGDYYYFFQRPQAACGSDGSQAAAFQGDTFDAAKQVAKSFTAAE
jgi:hypothetical protein